MSADKENGFALFIISFLVACLACALFAGYAAFKAAAVITAPPIKSDREICKERGGVYVKFHHGQDRCFSREAFK